MASYHSAGADAAGAYNPSSHASPDYQYQPEMFQQMPAEPEQQWDPELLGQALLNDESQSDWSAVTNLDAFFCKVYMYYVEKGFWCMIAARLTNLLTLAFTICFSTFLLLFVNWHSLLFCDGDDCDDVVGFSSAVFSSPTKGEALVFLYFSVFCVYWLWNALSFVYSLRDALEMRTFYKEDLAISDDDLISLEWHYILESLVHVSARKKLCIVKDLTALDITNRIMRKENYYIAMANLDLFQLGIYNSDGVINVSAGECCKIRGSKGRGLPRVQEMKEQRKVLRERKTGATAVQQQKEMKNPLLDTKGHALQVNVTAVPPSASSYSTFASPTAATGPTRLPGASNTASTPASASSSPSTSWWSWAIMGTTLDWNLRFCVLNSLFDSHFYVHSAYLGREGIQALKVRFMVLGCANLLLSPFIMLFMIIFFFLKHAEELHSKKSVFGPRVWNAWAQWKLREFNELPHFFERRLTLSSVAAHQYMQQFPNTLVSIIAQSIAYITGALVAILLLLTVTDSNIITHRLFDRTLLWWLAIFSAILGLSRSMIPDKTIYPAPALVMQEVVKHTHYAPAHWRHKAHTSEVHREFSYMYPSRLSTFCYEILSVVMTPFILIFCLPNSAERIVQFVTTRTVNVQGVGHLCSYAMFDIEKHGDSKYSHIPTSATGASTVSGLPAAPATTEQKDPAASAYRPPGTPLRQVSGGSSSLAFPLRLRHGKIEKSFLGFAMANPHWRPRGEEDGGSGQRFLGALAETMYGGGGQGEMMPGSPSILSRETSENRGGGRKGAASVRFAMHPASSSRLPSNSTHINRQDSLDSNTTDEAFDDAEHDTSHDSADDGSAQAKQQGHSGDPAKSTSASYMLSQSDRHLIQSFADLIGMDPSMQSTLHPSMLMRQNSLYGAASTAMGGAGGGGGMGSMMGMSTMLGLNQRRTPHASPQRATTGGGHGGGMQQSMMRSQFGPSASLYHPANSVLLGNSILGGRSSGGLQGGLSASALLHMDPQSLREGLMLAQADQQADLFALLESRLSEDEEEDAQEGMMMGMQHQYSIDEENPPDSIDEDDDTPRQDPITHQPPSFFPNQQQQQSQSSSSPQQEGGEYDPARAGYNASSSPPKAREALHQTTSHQQQYNSSGPTPAQPQAEEDPDNEPPPMSFFN